MKKIWLCTLVAALLFCLSVPVAAYDYDNAIRVRLAADAAPAVKIATGNYTVANSSGNLFTMAAGKSLTVKYSGQKYSFTYGGTGYSGSGTLKLSSADGKGRVTYKGSEYRGDLSFVYNDGSVYVINTLPMEQYLYSVVQKEIGGYYPSLEALKTQAVCARGLAVYWLKPNSYYDVVPTTTNQVYAGYTGEATGSYGTLVRQAVDDTRYLIGYYKKDDGKTVKLQPYYSANSGGYTEDVTNVWGSDPATYPYLRGVVAPWDSLPFIGENGTLKFPTGYHWTVVYSAAELADKLKAATGTDIGTLQSVTVSRRNTATGVDTVSGRIYKITYQGSKASVSFDKAKARTGLGFRSSLYDVIYTEKLTTKQPLNTLTLLQDKSFTDTLARSGDHVVFVGTGYGHGVGLSQWSTCVMAYEGMTYTQIMDWFFNKGKNDGRLTFAEYRY